MSARDTWVAFVKNAAVYAVGSDLAVVGKIRFAVCGMTVSALSFYSQIS